MSGIPWALVLRAAELAAGELPAVPGLVARVAIALARELLDLGCSIDGCPADVLAALQPADIPAEDLRMFDARTKARARVAGLTRPAIRAMADRDEVLALRGHPAVGDVNADPDTEPGG